MLDRIDIATVGSKTPCYFTAVLHRSQPQRRFRPPPPWKFVLAILKAGRFFDFSGGGGGPLGHLDIQNDSTRPSLLKAEMLRTNRWSFFNEKCYTRIRHLASSTNPRNPCKLVQYPTTNHPLDEMECLLWSTTNIRSWAQAYIIFKAPTCKTCEKTVVSFPPHVACDLGNLNERPGSKIFRKKKKHFQNTLITSQKKKTGCFGFIGDYPLMLGDFGTWKWWSSKTSHSGPERAARSLCIFILAKAFGAFFFSADPHGLLPAVRTKAACNWRNHGPRF